MGFDGADDEAMFDDFLRMGGSIQPKHESQIGFDDEFPEEDTAPMSVSPATKNSSGQGIHESILITD